MKYTNIKLFANKASPLFNKSNIKNNFNLDKDGLLRACELIALPGTELAVLDQKDNICTVLLPSYSNQPLYTDIRLLTEQKPGNPVEMPPSDIILKRLESALGKPYIWGGNFQHGIPEMLTLYPPDRPLSEVEKSAFTFSGVDCSGLLYEACNGLTPRNTSRLIDFGQAVDREALKPLDLIVWKGHVVIVFDEKYTIESRLGHGVILTPILKRFAEIDNDLRNNGLKSFSIRRFCDAE